MKRAKYKMQQSSVDSSIGQKAEFVRTQERNLVKAIAELNKGNCENELLQERIDQLRNNELFWIVFSRPWWRKSIAIRNTWRKQWKKLAKARKLATKQNRKPGPSTRC